MTVSLAGQTVVVTGGSRRLGRAIALECARAGADVAITYFNSHDDAQRVVEEMHDIGARTLGSRTVPRYAAFRCELSNAAAVLRLRDKTLEVFDAVTALVNNAAIFRRTPFEQTEYSAWEAAFDEHITSNLKAPFLLSKAFGDYFLTQGKGSILNIADIYGLRPLKNYAPYCAPKAGVIALTESLAKALAPHVRVNCLCPGTILPPSQKQGENDEVAALAARIPLGRLGTPEELAETVVFLLGGPAFISGAILPIDGAERLR